MNAAEANVLLNLVVIFTARTVPKVYHLLLPYSLVLSIKRIAANDLVKIRRLIVYIIHSRGRMQVDDSFETPMCCIFCLMIWLL